VQLGLEPALAPAVQCRHGPPKPGGCLGRIARGGARSRDLGTTQKGPTIHCRPRCRKTSR
jgi:hypothetical protein